MAEINQTAKDILGTLKRAKKGGKNYTESQLKDFFRTVRKQSDETLLAALVPPKKKAASGGITSLPFYKNVMKEKKRSGFNNEKFIAEACDIQGIECSDLTKGQQKKLPDFVNKLLISMTEKEIEDLAYRVAKERSYAYDAG